MPGSIAANGTVAGVRGRLITIEGIDGAGKSTLATALRAALERDRPVTLLREPGGVALSERIRELVKDPELRCDPRAEALLYAAARAQLVDERLEPLLAAGTWVLLDRFVDSSLAYQGAGPRPRRGGDRRRSTPSRPAASRPTARCCCGSPPRPGAPASKVATRRPTASSAKTRTSSQTIAAAYDALAAADPRRIRVLDADSPPDEVLSLALHALADLDSRAS